MFVVNWALKLVSEKFKSRNKYSDLLVVKQFIHSLIHPLYIYSFAKLSFKIILIYNQCQGSPDRSSPSLSEFCGVTTLLPHLSRAHPLLLWLAFSLGRGIPKGQGIPACRLMRDFPCPSSQPFSPLPSCSALSAVPRLYLSDHLLAQFFPMCGSCFIWLLRKSSFDLGYPSSSVKI